MHWRACLLALPRERRTSVVERTFADSSRQAKTTWGLACHRRHRVLGRPLVKYLVQQGRHVRVIGRRCVPTWCHNKSIEFVRGDITDFSIVEKALAGVGQVHHLAAATEGDWATHKAVTMDASAHLLDRFAAEGGGRVVFVSSLMVYDSGVMRNGVIVDEGFPIECNPERSSNYARPKTGAECTALTYLTHPHVMLTIVRPAVIYGPGTKTP